MIQEPQTIRAAVKRENAERYMLLSLVSFASTVILTRLFLQLAGYPQLGNSQLHIAHVLWGGLLLFIASLLPLILANRWAYNTAAVLSGVGVGLFIDEVGKFITQNNDYFYPPAAPIIYAFFLLTVLIYLRVRRPVESEPRTVLYHVLENMTEVLDHDLDPAEKARMEKRLANIYTMTSDPDLQALISSLISFLSHKHLRLVEPKPGYAQRIGKQISLFLKKYVTQPKLKMFLIFSLGLMGVFVIVDFVRLATAAFTLHAELEALLAPLIDQGKLRSAQEAGWFMIRTVLEGVTGFLLIISGGMIVTGKEHKGIQLAVICLVIWLSFINLLAYYFDQFSAVVTTLIQFFVLMALTYYRRKFLQTATE